MRPAYFNEFDPGAAAWLRELMVDGLIPQGEVDERSIAEVDAADLKAFAQVHLFAGIGGWSLALRLAGWPDDRPVWTGSCPCQPYSAAGKQKGDADERNLWPHMFRLIRECRPECVFGEQVEGAIRHGWLDGICADLEGEGYAVGQAVFGAHSVGAPHMRQRLYWVADATNDGRGRDGRTQEGTGANEFGRRGLGCGRDGCTCGVADSTSPPGAQQRRKPGEESWREADQEYAAERDGLDDGLDDSVCIGRGARTSAVPTGRDAISGASTDGGMGDTSSAGPQERGSDGGVQQRAGRTREGQAAELSGHWSNSRLIHCRDGKARRIPTQPELFPLADGIPHRVGLLRGAGNAIVPEDAAAFIEAYREAKGF